MTIIDDYLDYQEKYTKEYNENTLVLMQVGHFYEAYAVDNDHESVNADNIYKTADIMNIQVTRKNKSIVKNSRANPIMIGVNIYSKDKYIPILLNAGFTIVMIEQTTEPPNPKREVTQIYSPGTVIDPKGISAGASNNIMSIFIETNPNDPKKLFKNIGLSVIDFTTGKNTIYEVYSNKGNRDYNYSLDETFRFIQVYNPCEILIIVNETSENVDKIEGISNDYLKNYLNLSDTIVHYRNKDTINKEYSKIDYQATFLEKIFKSKNDSLLSIIEFLDIELLPIATISYIHLLDFAYTHNENIIQKIQVPDIFKSQNYMILTNNSINQLNVVSNANTNSNVNSLLAVVNKATTSIGRRHLKDQLLNPICDPVEIEKRYTYTDTFYKNNNYMNFTPFLMKITDIERLQRRLSLCLIQPADFFSLNYSYDQIQEILKLREQIPSDLIPRDDILHKFNAFIDDYSRVFNMNIIVKYNLDTITESIFNEGINAEIDETQKEIDTVKSTLDGLCKKFSKLVGNDIETLFKLEHTDKEGYYLYGTTIRCQNLKKAFANIQHQNILLGNGVMFPVKEVVFKVTQTTSKSKITSTEIKKLCRDYSILRDKIGKQCRQLFQEYLRIFDTEYGKTLLRITEFIGTIDVYHSAAKVAHMYGYSRPTIQEADETETASFIHAEEIRHPIIERIQTRIPYVPNDISINKSGILLYGTNASGKSSLMKAIGLNIILAQAGFYTASKSFTYYPYQYLFTRILNNDNIFKGESSFAVEMNELRSILKRVNKNSLVLGDELCSGTENISAQSIFASTVIKLSRMNSSFIFATHLHQLNDMKCITELENVNSFHLAVEFNKETGELIYDRRMKEGNGPTIYGLEVCKAMDLDKDFIEMADAIRREILELSKELLPVHKSKYNAKVIVNDCEVCDQKAEDVHHIKFQCSADGDNIIAGYIDKNTESNLVPLCKQCHNNVHHGNLEIRGYIQTSSGIKLDYSYASPKEKATKRKKYSQENIELIKDLYKDIQSKARLIEVLDKNHLLSISQGTLNKILKNEY